MSEYDSSRASYLDTAFSSWHISTLTGPVEQGAWTDDVRPAEQRYDQFSMLIPHDDSNSRPEYRDEPRRLTSNPAGTDMVERVACIPRCLGTMGFDNLDELVCTYYTQNFHESSFLCNEQRLSRHRRLPGVFSSVFRASGNLSIWERSGFQEEVSKATEEALLSESWEAQSDIQPRFAHMLEAPKSNLPCVASRVSPVNVLHYKQVASSLDIDDGFGDIRLNRRATEMPRALYLQPFFMFGTAGAWGGKFFLN